MLILSVSVGVCAWQDLFHCLCCVCSCRLRASSSASCRTTWTQRLCWAPCRMSRRRSTGWVRGEHFNFFKLLQRLFNEQNLHASWQWRTRPLPSLSLVAEQRWYMNTGMSICLVGSVHDLSADCWCFSSRIHLPVHPHAAKPHLVRHFTRPGAWRPPPAAAPEGPHSHCGLCAGPEQPGQIWPQNWSPAGEDWYLQQSWNCCYTHCLSERFSVFTLKFP